jgi:hypothetical protein
MIISVSAAFGAKQCGPRGLREAWGNFFLSKASQGLVSYALMLLCFLRTLLVRPRADQ